MNSRHLRVFGQTVAIRQAMSTPPKIVSLFPTRIKKSADRSGGEAISRQAPFPSLLPVATCNAALQHYIKANT